MGSAAFTPLHLTRSRMAAGISTVFDEASVEAV
jgi:hypothetical protein